jgi:hypothetical protein
MRDVRFKMLPPVGPHPGIWTYGTLEQFALRLAPIYYALTVLRTLPSLEDINREFLKGRYSMGMSGGTEWKPFTITEDEYNELCEAFITRPGMDVNRPATA